jgi:hypothetical protein
MGAKPVEMLALMMFESGISPSKPNGLGYYGLIQFGDAAATTIGTTTAKLRVMSRVQQMQYVDKYFTYWIKHTGVKPPITLSQMYCMTGYPAYTNYPATAVLASRNGPRIKLWTNNPAWRGPDGIITRESLGNAPRSRIARVEAILARNNITL